ncbi:inositol polyphosphate-5-phosphatase F [Cryptococcus wingfieldii CBS 7118]|uniref:Inositol polyphosphate-5-phosphatase F n=1 Tax=Cryptococcus wingfieldii CBS 7118 TaxID=1295528 RepID=A0A1E3INH4_9TREE|nr:inositol polyphosphate-5-phosphatase F [Cryptococcus wingfieldii CBS 7118]ODN90157.1 inositol polyphosphate-5-phosphatase F [Cryptococcus wingfieldii CBS 7118]
MPPSPYLPPRFTVPPLPPTLHRRMNLLPHDAGIILAPPGGAPGVLIGWGVRGKIEPLDGAEEGELVLGGVLGIARLWDAAYLFVFLPRTGTPLFPPHDDDEPSHEVYTLGDIHAIPLTRDGSAVSIKRLIALQESRKPKPKATSRWSLAIPISGAGALPQERDHLAASSDEDDDDDEPLTPEADESPIPTKARQWTKFIPKFRKRSESSAEPPKRQELEEKIVRQIKREFENGFFFSYDFDITHSLQAKRHTVSQRAASGAALADLIPKENSLFPPSVASTLRSSNDTPTGHSTGEDFVEPDIYVPLWRRADKRFFWNEYLMKDFIDLGLHSYVVPVMQGWVQSSTFTIPIPPSPLDPTAQTSGVPVDIAVISRRSKDRAGLRYQRRGIDDNGHVANMVETEMTVRAKVEGKMSLFSFTQVRGSIPLRWSQSPYSMKPPPVLNEPVDKTYAVANLHFNDLVSRYGHITIINLSEQHGKEAPITNGYKQLTTELERDDVTYTEFDFHAKCSGMKWENIVELVDSLDFETMGYLWTLQGEALREQQGAFRTNCIDCLDRTNVVQSAIARRVLVHMLIQLGLQAEGPVVENVFNDIWANNGDMISLCYAHTSALKGDFVRTGKRDFSGMLHDGVSSLSRMFYGAISDFFAQAVISFLLGHRNLAVFSEFLETLTSEDAASVIKLDRLRNVAIETCSARVLSEGEDKIGGWILLSPEAKSTKISSATEEKILILTQKAIYVASFNYSLEKVTEFTRIPLASITQIQRGAYILSTLQEASRDPKENAGLIIQFSPADESTRYSTYSLRNKAPPPSATSSEHPLHTPLPSVEHASIDPLAKEFFAFKALPGQSGDATCMETVKDIVSQLEKACKRDGLVVEKDIVSLTEAESSTTLLAKMDYAFKRALWL